MDQNAIQRRHMLLGLAGLPLLLGSCGTGGEGEPGKTSLVFGEQRSMRPMAVSSHALDKLPYDFKWATFATPSVMFEAFRAGELDLSSSNDVTILNAAANDVKLKIVAALRGGLLRNLGIIVRKDSSVRTVRDLKGRKIIVSSARGGSGDNVLHGALREAGLKPSDVSISYAPFNDSLSAFRSNAVEILVTNDPYLILAQQHGGRLIRDGVGLNSGLALVVAADKSLADPAKRSAIGDVLGRLKTGVDWCRDNPEAYAAAYAKEFGLEVDLVRRMHERAPTRMLPITEDIIATEQKVADDLLAREFWDKPLVVRSFFDATLLSAGAVS